MKQQLFSAALLSAAFAASVCLSACHSAIQPSTLPSQQSQTITLKGVVSTRGAQMEAWWALRAQDGTLWRLEPATEQIKVQLARLNQQTAQVQGTKLGSAHSGDFPTLLVNQIQ